jgi:hypothetical protein
MLDRLGLTHTRGQGYALSPDEQFEAKRAFIGGIRMRSGADELEESPEKRPEQGTEDRLFYLDELTYELHPTIDKEWSLAGDQPTAERGSCGQREGRLLSAMDTESGQLFYRQKQSVGRADLIGLYREMVDACDRDSEPARLWVVQDNAPFLDCVQSLFTLRCWRNWSRRCGSGHTRPLSIRFPASGQIRPMRLSPTETFLYRLCRFQPTLLG